MPTLNLKSQKLQCPFCSTVSTRGTGLSSHVRTQHSREYGKWNKNPNRLLEAAAAASAQKEPRKTSPPARPKAKEKEKKDNRMTAPASVLGPTPASTVSVAASVPMPGAAPNSAAHEHLQTALQEQAAAGEAQYCHYQTKRRQTRRECDIGSDLSAMFVGTCMDRRDVMPCWSSPSGSS